MQMLLITTQIIFRTQDLEPWFKENSNFYLFTKVFFKLCSNWIKPIMQEVANLSKDDTPDDWDFAEVVIEFYRKKGYSSESKVLITCPPMLGLISKLKQIFRFKH